MIELKNINKTYINKGVAHTVLRNINLEIKPGEIFGIIGKSGAGKSTLLRCINLLDKPDSGAVIINGADITQMSKSALRKTRQQIGVIFQGFNLLKTKSVFDNILLPLKLQGVYTKEAATDRVMELLNVVGLTQYKDKYPASLSGGQKQRVGIARALATNPDILLCDEATSALDPQTTTSILDLLLEINQKFKITIVLVTHEIDVVRKICDQVAVVDNGEIVEIGPTVDVILHPRQALTRKLIIEEETSKYLEQVSDFYRFNKSANAHLVVISFLGEKTFAPILHTIMRETGVICTILRGELGRIKKIPFGQLLIEITGEDHQLKAAFDLVSNMGIHYEIIA